MHHSKVGSLLFMAFMVAQFFSLTRTFFVDYLGEGVRNWATIASFASIVLLPIIILEYRAVSLRETDKGYLSQGGQVWIMLLFMLVVMLMIYGMEVGYGLPAVLEDTAVYLIFISFVVLGSSRGFREDMMPVLLVLTIIALAINILGLQDVNVLLQHNTDRIARELLAYKSRTSIDMWGFLLLTIQFWRRRSVRLIIFAAAFFALVLQLFFQKRLPILEVFAFYGVFFFLMARYENRWYIIQRDSLVSHVRRNFLTMSLIFGVVTLLYLPTAIQGQIAGLLGRFTREDDSRINESIGMIGDLDGLEYIIGRGMGGYFQYTDESGFSWGTFVPEVGVIGKTTVHIGILMPILKGGILLATVFYFGWLLVIQRWRLFSRDYFTFAAFSYLGIKTIVYLQGGFLIMSGIFDVILVAFCIGYILSLPVGESAPQVGNVPAP